MTEVTEESAMRQSILKLALPLAAAALLAPAISRAQQDEWTTDPEQPGTSEQAPAPGEAPAQKPPTPPPAASPAPPPQQAAVPPGQWVFTAQYGWVWMPYATSYTYLPPDGGYPLMYAYYPAYGWAWLAAPWVWGVGPWPWFGVSGGIRFVWYHPYYRPYYRPYYPYGRPYAAVGPWRTPAFRGGVVVRPAPVFRGGAVVRPAPVVRGAAGVRAAPRVHR
jgi:hypothetical protein